jgi:hypothetical protein
MGTGVPVVPYEHLLDPQGFGMSLEARSDPVLWVLPCRQGDESVLGEPTTPTVYDPALAHAPEVP